MSEIPIISVTNDHDDDLSDDEQDDYDFRDAYTDVEDLDDSYADRSLKLNSLSVKKTKSSPATTDIEDYNDSSDDEGNLDPISEAPISLTEFLEQQGTVEQEDGAANKITTKTGNKLGSLFVSYLDDDLGAITDCENMDSSGDEMSIADNIENDISISAYLPEAENVNISDKLSKHKEEDEDNDSPISVSEAGDFCHPDEVSDAEDFLVSDAEDDTIYKQVCDLSRPKLLLTRVEPIKEEISPPSPSTSRPPMAYLEITDIEEDNLTDIDKLDLDTDEEFICGAEPYLAPIVEKHRPSLTDIEDIDISDSTDLLIEPQQVSSSNIPSPIREITIVRSDVSGQGISSVMPLKDDIDIGLEDNYNQGLTDTEEISGVEDDLYEFINTAGIEQIPEIYNGITKNSEVIKVMHVKRSETANECEPTTDIEEIFLAGTVRRKKSTKSKNQGRNKKMLDVKQPDYQVKTDEEEFDISDVEAVNKSRQVLQVASTSRSGKESPDIKTDIEYVSGDDELSVSEGEDINLCHASAISETSFYTTVTTMESISQIGQPHKRPTPREVAPRHRFEITSTNNQNITDVEDFNLPSDVEENYLNTASYSRADTISPYEMQDALNDSSRSIVHEKCGSTFDIDKEKLHIKGLRDCVDANTDVEYLEDEIDIGKENNQPRK